MAAAPTPTPLASPSSRHALAFLFVTVFLDMLAMGIVSPVLPRLVQSFAIDTAQSALFVGGFATSFALMQFLCGPTLGGLSDRFGRRPVIILSNLGLALSSVMMALAPGLGVLFAARILAGITGASLGVAGAYIADSLPPARRAGGFGMITLAFGLGFILGPALGGVAGQTGPRLPFWIAGGCAIANALYGLFVLPESLPAERRAALSWRRANPLGALGFLRGKPGLGRLVGIHFLGNLAQQSMPTLLVLYGGYRYGWDARAVGFVLSGLGLGLTLVGGLLVRRAVARFGERPVLIAGLGCGIAGYAGFALATTPLAFCLAVPIATLGGLAPPALQGLMTRRVDGREQGRLQGAVTSVTGITGMLGPALFSAVFAVAIRPSAALALPGLPYLIAATCQFIGITLALRATRPISEPVSAATGGA
jgi:DHA1 family tetracycline resistance protein-like MFS transporter